MLGLPNGVGRQFCPPATLLTSCSGAAVKNFAVQPFPLPRTFTVLTHNINSSHLSLIFPHVPLVPGRGRAQLWWPLSLLNGCARVQWPLSAFPDKVFWGFERARKGRIAEWEELTSQNCCLWKEVEFAGFSCFPVLSYETGVWGH